VVEIPAAGNFLPLLLPEPTLTSPSRFLRGWLRDLVIAGAIFGLVYLAVGYMGRRGQRGGGGVLPVGEPAADFRLRDVRTGKWVSLSDGKGQPAVVNFWATSCPSCRAEIPALNRVCEAGRGRYRILTIVNEDPARVRAFLREHPMCPAVLLDPTGAVLRAYHVRPIPMTVLVDAHGDVVHDFVGAADEGILQENLDRLSAEASER